MQWADENSLEIFSFTHQSLSGVTNNIDYLRKVYSKTENPIVH